MRYWHLRVVGRATQYPHWHPSPPVPLLQKARDEAQDRALARYQRKKEREEIARQEAEEAQRQERERMFAKMRAQQERIMDNRVRACAHLSTRRACSPIVCGGVPGRGRCTPST